MASRSIRVLAGLVATFSISLAAWAQESDIDGATLFARYCASCHGPLGEGDGPVAGAILGPVPNLRNLSTRGDGVFPRDAVMRYIDGRDLPAAHGERLMPVWGTTFEELSESPVPDPTESMRLIEAITTFIESLQN